MKNKIKKIARQVRTELKSFIGKNGFNAQPHLGGLCGYGAVMLHEALNKNNLKTKIAAGGGHWFAVCGDYLVDVTASQFGQPQVVVRDYNKIKHMINSGEYQMNWWNANALHDSACGANLCNLKQQIEKARQSKAKCNSCGEEYEQAKH